jgi:membrane fusion protein (multidrug efflux system)
VKWLTASLLALELLVYPYVVSVSGECRLTPGTVQRARAAIAGQVEAVLVGEGQAVKRGDVLLRLDDHTLRQDLQHALSERQAASTALARASEREMKAAGNTMKASLRYWQQEVERVQSALELTVLRANIDGQVITPSPGSLVHQQVEPGQELLVIADTQQVVAEILVAERDIGSVATGQQAFVRAYTDSGASHASVVQSIVPVAERGPLGTFIVVKARIDNADQRLLPGTTGVAKILGERQSGFRWLARKLTRF